MLREREDTLLERHELVITDHVGSRTVRLVSPTHASAECDSPLALSQLKHGFREIHHGADGQVLRPKAAFLSPDSQQAIQRHGAAHYPDQDAVHTPELRHVVGFHEHPHCTRYTLD